MNYGIIYLARCTVNGKSYIGQTIQTCHTRIREHLSETKRGSTLCFHNAIRKYGIEKFEWDIIDDTAINQEELDALEIYYIEEFDCISPKGYNLKGGGNGGRLSSRTIEAIRQSNKMYYNNPTVKAACRKRSKEYYENHPEILERLSQIRKNYYKDFKAREVQSQRLKQYLEENPAVLESQSKRLKDYNSTLEARERRRVHMIARYSKPEERELQRKRVKKFMKECSLGAEEETHIVKSAAKSKAVKDRYSNVSERELQSKRLKAYCADPKNKEARENRIEKVKETWRKKKLAREQTILSS